MAIPLADRKRVTTDLKSWLDDVAGYERTFRGWEQRARKILDRYRDEHRDERDSYGRVRFNILWSNTQTLVSATFARTPKPDVSRRFKDNDPVGRIASQILERALDYEIQHYSDYRTGLKACVYDRFLPGRGTAWVRYEPKFVPGAQVTEDEEAPQVLDYECVPVDYVHWRDFGHTVARSWEEVRRVWRRVYMSYDALVSRFGEETADLVPMDASPMKEDNYDKNALDVDRDRACIYEGWDKEAGEAVWFSKGVKDFLDRKPDPLKLEEFFPCPRPLYSTMTNDTLVPVPDFTLYQDQASELDILSQERDGLIRALQVRGVYDSSVESLKRIFTEGNNGELLPVANWQAFAEKNGLKGAIDIVDIGPIAAALLANYQAFDQVKNQIYEITRISDIMRGFVDPQEKLGQSQLKTQYGNLGIKSYQEQVAQFATELLQIKAQVMCGNFEPQTLLAISAADQLTVSDADVLAVAPQLGQPAGMVMGPMGQPQPAPPPIATMTPQQKKDVVFRAALQLLMGDRVLDPKAQGKNPLRSFRVEIAADTLVQIDEEMEKQSRLEFLKAVGAYTGEMVKVVGAAGPLAMPILPMMAEGLKFGAQAFKAGRQMEGVIDEMVEKLRQIAANPPKPQPDPAMIKAHTEMQTAPIRAKAEEAKATATIAAAQADTAQAAMDLEKTRIQAANPAAFSAPEMRQ